MATITKAQTSYEAGKVQVELTTTVHGRFGFAHLQAQAFLLAAELVLVFAKEGGRHATPRVGGVVHLGAGRAGVTVSVELMDEAAHVQAELVVNAVAQTFANRTTADAVARGEA